MKRIITAMGNPTLNNELKKYSKYDVIYDDLLYQEAVIDVLNEECVDIIIISGILQGQWDFIDFINEIKKIDKLSRIIVITDEITEELKEAMFSKGIFDIFVDNNVNVTDIIDAIDREEPITKKIAKVKDNLKEINVVKEPEQIYITKTQKQEIIAVSGINGSGKSTITSKLANIIALKSNSKILIIDLDTLNGNLDELFNINKVPPNIELLIDEDKKCGLNYAAELINKNRFDSNVFEEIVIKVGDIDILTGNTSLHFCQNVLNEKCYEKILDVAKEKYDFIIFDTSSNIFLDSTKWAIQKANRIFFVTENNYISLKKTNQMLNIFLNVWKVWKNKIQVIVNKELSNGVEIELIENLLGDIDIITSIKMQDENNEVAYEKILKYINYVPKISFTEKIKSSIFKIINKNSEYNKMGEVSRAN